MTAIASHRGLSDSRHAPEAGAALVTSPAGPASQGRWVLAGLSLLLSIEYLGLHYQFPFLSLLKIPTLLAAGLFAVALLKGDHRMLLGARQNKLIVGLIVLTITSVAYAVVRTYAIQSITGIVGYFGLGIVAAYAVNRTNRTYQLATVLSIITIVLVVRNLSALNDPTRSLRFAAGYFLGDGNDYAWGLNVLLPFSVYLALAPVSLTRRLIGAAGVACALLGIVGTASRGGSLALAAVLGFYWLFVAKRKTAGAVLVAIVTVGVLFVAPDSYTSRMGTIATYEEDSSATSRILAWKAAVQMALDYPLGVGAGSFNSAYGRYYMPAEARTAKWISAHSVYFKTLGEYGFPGLALFLTLLWLNLRAALAAGAPNLSGPTLFPQFWPQTLGMALVGYAVGGMFLGGIFYPHLYLVTGLIIGCHARTVGVVTDVRRPQAKLRASSLIAKGPQTVRVPDRSRGLATPAKALSAASRVRT